MSAIISGYLEKSTHSPPLQRASILKSPFDRWASGLRLRETSKWMPEGLMKPQGKKVQVCSYDYNYCREVQANQQWAMWFWNWGHKRHQTSSLFSLQDHSFYGKPATLLWRYIRWPWGEVLHWLWWDASARQPMYTSTAPPPHTQTHKHNTYSTTQSWMELLP